MLVKRRRDVNAGRSGGRVVFGPHTVEEHLRSGAGAVVEVWLSATGQRSRRSLVDLASAAGVAVNTVAPSALDLLCGHPRHQGVVARLREFEYLDFEEAVARRPDLIVAADGIEDPRNLGALLRAAAAAGAGAVLIPRDRAAQVTAVTEKAAAGVTAWFPVIRVVNLARALAQLADEAGYWTIGLTHDAEGDLFRADVPSPTVLVVGGESGLRPLVRRQCHLQLRIPMASRVESLNVAVAAAVAAFELRRRLSATAVD